MFVVVLCVCCVYVSVWVGVEVVCVCREEGAVGGVVVCCTRERAYVGLRSLVGWVMCMTDRLLMTKVGNH